MDSSHNTHCTSRFFSVSALSVPVFDRGVGCKNILILVKVVCLTSLYHVHGLYGVECGKECECELRRMQKEEVEANFIYHDFFY